MLRQQKDEEVNHNSQQHSGHEQGQRSATAELLRLKDHLIDVEKNVSSITQRRVGGRGEDNHLDLLSHLCWLFDWFDLTFLPECLTADRKQLVKGATQTAGEPEQFSQQPDVGAAAAHQHSAGAEHGLAHADSQAAGRFLLFPLLLKALCLATTTV